MKEINSEENLMIELHGENISVDFQTPSKELSKILEAWDRDESLEINTLNEGIAVVNLSKFSVMKVDKCRERKNERRKRKK